MKLRISVDGRVVLPVDAVTSTFALLAVRGAGKSNGGAVMAEEMHRAGLPFVVIDPVGGWYGLRAGRDGNPTGGLPVPIFGGKHGDLPLERGAGQFIADLIVEKRLSSVLDLSGFGSEGDKKAFLLAFAQRIYQKNEDPLHLFLEESDDYIAQRPMRDEAQLLRAWENIVRRGRARGLGITLITQRSAAINKMVLTQVETLFALRTTGPQDIAAIEAWVRYHQVDQELLRSLAGLEDGEAWVWSPHYLKKIERFRFRMRDTFDSGATPKNLRGKDQRKPATLADIDLGALRERLASTIEKAKADDPRELRRRIAELEKQLAQKPAAAPAKPERVEVPVVPTREQIRGPVYELAEAVREQFTTSEFRARLEGAVVAIERQCQELAKTRHVPHALANEVVGPVLNPPAPIPSQVPATLPVLPRRRSYTPPAAREALGKGERVVLTAVAQHGVAGVTRTQLAIVTGYKRSTRDAYIQRLSAVGRVEQQGERIVATNGGIKALGPDFEPLPTGAALLEHWLRRLPEGERRILEILSHLYPQGASREFLSQQTGYARSSRDAYIQRLGARRLVVPGAHGEVRAAEELF